MSFSVYKEGKSYKRLRKHFLWQGSELLIKAAQWIHTVTPASTTYIITLENKPDILWDQKGTQTHQWVCVGIWSPHLANENTRHTIKLEFQIKCVGHAYAKKWFNQVSCILPCSLEGVEATVWRNSETGNSSRGAWGHKPPPLPHLEGARSQWKLGGRGQTACPEKSNSHSFPQEQGRSERDLDTDSPGGGILAWLLGGWVTLTVSLIRLCPVSSSVIRKYWHPSH